MACFNSFPQNRFVISTLFSSSNILNLAMDKMLVSISNKTSEYGLVFFDLTLMSYFDLIVYHGLIRFPQTIFFLFPWGLENAERCFNGLVSKDYHLHCKETVNVQNVVQKDIRVYLWLSERYRNWNEKRFNDFPVCLSHNFHFLIKLFEYDRVCLHRYVTKTCNLSRFIYHWWWHKAFLTEDPLLIK